VSLDQIGHADRAAFYRTSLFLGLVRGDAVVRWADRTLAHNSDVLPAFIEIATIPAEDLTALRLALLGLCNEQESARVIGAVFGLINRHLVSGQRSAVDTITVLMQARRSMRLEPALSDELRQIELAFWRSERTGDTGSLEARLHTWLGHYRGTEERFLDEAGS